MKCYLIFALFILISRATHALSLENSDIRLLCPQRGQINVILHHYEHTQELWGRDQFETGGGHTRKGPFLMFQFANLDQLIFNEKTGDFSYWYADIHQLVSCRMLSITNTYPNNIPYYRE